MKKIKFDDMEKLGRRYVAMHNPKYEKSPLQTLDYVKPKWHQKKVVKQTFNIATSIVGGTLLVIPQTRAITMIAMSILPKKPKLLKSIFDYFKKGD